MCVYALWVHERWDCKKEGAVEVATVHHHTSAVSPSSNQDSPLLPHKDSFTIRVIPVTLQKLHNWGPKNHLWNNLLWLESFLSKWVSYTFLMELSSNLYSMGRTSLIDPLMRNLMPSHLTFLFAAWHVPLEWGGRALELPTKRRIQFGQLLGHKVWSLTQFYSVSFFSVKGHW